MTPIERGYWRLRNITRMTRARREIHDSIIALCFFCTGLLILAIAEGVK